jgi:Ca2+-transporting ATPase
LDLLNGDAIDAMGDRELQDALKTIRVCARVAPAQKLRIVQALKANGEIVATRSVGGGGP